MKLGMMMFALVTLTACPPAPAPVTPVPDASDASAFGDTTSTPPSPSDPCAAACASLAAAGCAIGSGDASACASFLRTLSNPPQGSGLPNPANGNKPLTCADVVPVKTKADAQKLGFACP